LASRSFSGKGSRIARHGAKTAKKKERMNEPCEESPGFRMYSKMPPQGAYFFFAFLSSLLFSVFFASLREIFSFFALSAICG
jgi:hypothetical protein